MKPELTLLVWSVILAIVHMLIAVQALVSTKGLMAAVGNREGRFVILFPPGTQADRMAVMLREQLGAGPPH